MTKDLETKINKLVANWNGYKNAIDERSKKYFTEEVEYSLDSAMSQYLKDTNSTWSSTYQYIIDEMPNSEGKQSLESITRISNIIGTDELNDENGSYIIDENFFDYKENYQNEN